MNIRTSLRRMLDHISGRAAAQKTLHEFMERFPGRCPICAYHRYGVSHGHASGPTPPHEACPERAA